MSSDFLTSVLPTIVVIGIADVLTAYAAYTALTVWRGMSISIFRSRALWTAILAVLVGILLTLWNNVNALFPQPYYDLGIAIEYFLLAPAVVVVLLVWIDRTMKTLIRLDYLRRDVAGWRRFNLAYWTLVALDVAVSYLPAVVHSSTLPVLTPLLAFLSLSPLIILLVYSSYSLFLGSRKTPDTTFRRHLAWLGCSVLAMFLVVLVVSIDPTGTQPALDHLPFILMAYCLYRLSRSLVPVNRFQPDVYQEMPRV
jgi:hypothetical protein